MEPRFITNMVRTGKPKLRHTTTTDMIKRFLLLVLSIIALIFSTAPSASAQFGVPYQAPVNPFNASRQVTICANNPFCGRQYTAMNGRVTGQLCLGQQVMFDQSGQPCAVPMVVRGRFVGWLPITLVPQIVVVTQGYSYPSYPQNGGFNAYRRQTRVIYQRGY